MYVPNLSTVNEVHRWSQQLERQQEKEETARQLEGMFASVLIKTMRETTGGEGLFPGDKADVLGGLFDQYMGEAISSGRGLGLSAAIRSQLLGDGANHVQS